MNAEIYFPREGKSFAQTSNKAFESTVKKLNETDVNIIYKTEVNLTENSLLDAFKVTDSGDEKIGLVIIADGIDEDNSEKAEGFFRGIGVIEKVKRIEYSDSSDEEAKKIPDNMSRQEAKQLEKLRKQQEKELKKMYKGQKNSSDILFSENSNKKLFAYSAEHNGKLIILLPDIQKVDTDFNNLLFNIVNTALNPKKKDSFWKRFIPCSGDRPVDVVRKVVLMLAICTFIVSSYMLVDILLVEPAISDNINNDIKNLFVSTDDGENSGSGGSKSQSSGEVLADFKKLLEVNPDTIGWLNVPNTVIDYVVVKPSEDKDPEYYLYRDFYGNDSKYGTVFMDYRSTLESKNIILHGHHMQDGRMFAQLTKYTDLDFYKENPTITFNTIYNKDKWQIVSIFKTNTLEEQGEFFNYLRGDFSTDYDFLNFVYDLKARSIIDCPVTLNENDTLLTLSTCAYDFDDFRLVVVARKVRDGESEKLNTSKAEYNPSPLYPDVWYKTYGGTAPKVTTFQEAYNNGKIDWYDGKKTDWSAEDDDLLARELKEAKTKSVKKLKEYASKKEYAEDEQKKIDELVKNYTKQLNAAKSADELNNVYSKAVKAIDKIKTAEQLASEQSAKEESERKENEIKNTRSAAIVEIKNSIAGNTYRMTQADQANSVISDYSDKINKEKDLDKIEEYKQEAIDKLAKIKTDDELKKEESEAAEQSKQDEEKRAAKELSDAKSSAVSELESYLSMDDYYSEQQEEINGIISEGKKNINGSKDKSAVSTALSDAKSKLDNVKTSTDIDAENSEAQEPSGEESVSSEESSGETSLAEESLEAEPET